MKNTFAVVIIMLIASSSQAQVIVAPTILFMSDQSRFGTFMVMNRSNSPQEVSVSFRFGYPESDSVGNIRMQYDDSLMAEKHSCESWVKGFPQKFVVNPGQQQVVRLLVIPPPNISDGEYWTRLVTSSTPQAKAIDTVKTGISANITFVLQQVTTIIYRRGIAFTSVSLPKIRVAQDSASVNLYAQIDRGGNSPFFGKISVVITDRVGNNVYDNDEAIAVYQKNMIVRFAMPLSKLQEGAYTADLKLESERNDIQQGDMLKVTPIEKTVKFTVP